MQLMDLFNTGSAALDTYATRRAAFLSACAPLLTRLSNSHRIFYRHGLVLAVPNLLVDALANRAAPPEPGEAYPEILLLARGFLLTPITGETVRSARLFDVAEAYKTMWLEPTAGGKDLANFQMRALKAEAAVKAAKYALGCAATATGLDWSFVERQQGLSENIGDGGADLGLLVDGVLSWVQVSGGDRPELLQHAKWPDTFSRSFFETEQGPIRSGAAKRRAIVYPSVAGRSGNVLQIAVGRAPPLARYRNTRGGSVERQPPSGKAPLWSRTATLTILTVKGGLPELDYDRAAEVLRHFNRHTVITSNPPYMGGPAGRRQQRLERPR
jgi:hypothetical protein